MTAAALMLAMSLLTAPNPARHRIRTPRRIASRPPAVVVLPGVGAVALALIALGSVGPAVAAAIIGATVEVRRRRVRRRRRRAAEATALQDALEVLVGELRVGAHPVAAFGIAADEVTGVVARSLRTVAARARVGADPAAGLRSVARRSDLPLHWERLALCWQLAQAHGLAVATLMQAAQRDIAERERFSARVQAQLAGARTTGAVLAGLPALGIGLGQLIGARPLAFLLSGGVGAWLLIIGVGLACIGLMWCDRITGQVLK
jgi:tight adherence protein B